MCNRKIFRNSPGITAFSCNHGSCSADIDVVLVGNGEICVFSQNSVAIFYGDVGGLSRTVIDERVRVNRYCAGGDCL